MPIPSDPVDLQLKVTSFPEGLISILPNPDPVTGPLESTDWDHFYGDEDHPLINGHEDVQLGGMVMDSDLSVQEARTQAAMMQAQMDQAIADADAKRAQQ